MYCNVSVVYSSHLGELEDQEFEKMLRKTSGLLEGQLEILKYENHNEYSLTELYNRGLKESKHCVVLFIHNDTRFVKNEWGPVLLEKFNTSDFGIIGLAGTNKVLREHQGQWFKYAGYNAGFIYHPDGSGGMEETWLCNKLNFIIPAVVVDGVFMAITKDRIAMVFDEDFKGFHFYDISFCIRNFEKGVKVGIIADLSIILYHNSKGRYNEEWNRNRLEFLNKYRNSYIAPIILDVPETNFSFAEIEFQRWVHIIILTKNKTNLLFRCLESIAEETTYPFYSVWVADTGSDIQCKELMRSKISELNEKAQKENVFLRPGFDRFNLLEFNYYHFSKINNEVVRMLEAARHIQCDDFLLFCNNDVELLNDCVSGCIDTYCNYERKGVKVGTIGIRMHFKDNSVQHSGLMFSNLKNYVHITHKYYHSSYYYAQDTEECLGNTGAFLFTPYRIFKKMGMFNEKYREVYQDAEYNLECIVNGYTNLIAGKLVAYHYESQTRNGNINKEYNSTEDRNNIFFPYLIKNHRSFRKFLHPSNNRP